MSNKHHFKDSQSIRSCDYHDNTGTLELEFESGGTYHYPDCAKDHYHALKQAASAGRYFHSNIRKLKSIKVK